MNTQGKFFALLDTAVTEAGYELVVDSQWANTGTLRIQAVGEFAELLALPYDFQGGRATFGRMGRRESDPAVFAMRPNPRFASFDPGELGDAIWAILDYALSGDVPPPVFPDKPTTDGYDEAILNLQTAASRVASHWEWSQNDELNEALAEIQQALRLLTGEEVPA